METDPRCINLRAGLFQLGQHHGVDLPEIFFGNKPFGCCRLVANAGDHKAHGTKRFDCLDDASQQMDVLGTQRRLGAARYGIGNECVQNAVSVQEDGRAAVHEFDAGSEESTPADSDSQCPALAANAGCDTRECQTTAWKDSTRGVRRSDGGSTTIATSAS